MQGVVGSHVGDYVIFFICCFNLHHLRGSHINCK